VRLAARERSAPRFFLVTDDAEHGEDISRIRAAIHAWRVERGDLTGLCF